MMPACVFCDIANGVTEAQVLRRWLGVWAFVPLNPVVDGHVLVVPRAHVVDALESPAVTAEVMRRAAQIAPRPCNIITSAGVEATQTVMHLHVHVVPRRAGDGLALPWTGQA